MDDVKYSLFSEDQGLLYTLGLKNMPFHTFKTHVIAVFG